MGEAQKLCRFGLDTHLNSTLVQSCRGTSIIKAVLHYTGVNKVSGYTREREFRNWPSAWRSQEKRFFFCEISITSCFWSGSGQEQLSHSAGALVFPSPMGQEAPGSLEIKLREPLAVQESTALGWVKAAARGQVLFCLNLFLCPKWQHGNNNVRYETQPWGWATSPAWHDLEVRKHVWCKWQWWRFCPIFKQSVSPILILTVNAGGFVYWLLLTHTSTKCYHSTTKLNRENISRKVPAILCTPGLTLSQRQPHRNCSATKLEGKVPGWGRKIHTTSNLSCQLHPVVL